MWSFASGVTRLTPGQLHHRGPSGVARLFAGDGVLLRKHVRSDDLITFGAEKGDSLVSAILSVKYSCSGYSAVPSAVLPTARAVAGLVALR